MSLVVVDLDHSCAWCFGPLGETPVTDAVSGVAWCGEDCRDRAGEQHDEDSTR